LEGSLDGQRGDDGSRLNFIPDIAIMSADAADDSRGARNAAGDDFPPAGDAIGRIRHLLSYAILAPSTCNTQPWAFAVYPNQIRVYADTTRWLRINDPDQRELQISVGCALENLLVAAEFHGYDCAASYAPDPLHPDLLAVVRLRYAGARPTPGVRQLHEAIARRRTNHQQYDSRPIPNADLAMLRKACGEFDVTLDLTDDPKVKRRVDELNTRADALVFSNAEWRDEYARWIGDGAFSSSWWTAKLAQLSVQYLDLCGDQVKKDSELLMHSPVLGLLSTAADDAAARVCAGRAFERFFLTATSLGISVQPMSQIVEIPAIRAKLAELLPGDPRVPQQPFRIGYAPPDEHPRPRRSLDSVLIPT
jgi:nitroreductase